MNIRVWIEVYKVKSILFLKHLRATILKAKYINREDLQFVLFHGPSAQYLYIFIS